MPGLRQCHTARKPKEILLLPRVCQKAATGIREKQRAALVYAAFFVRFSRGIFVIPLIFRGALLNMYEAHPDKKEP